MQCAPEEVGEEEEGKIEYGGRLNAGWSIGQVLETLRCDSGWQYIDMGCMFWQMVYDQLWMMGPGPDYEPVPRLATSWETEDRKTWTYHLRHDAVFHDGVPVTAEDVAFTLEYLPKLPEWHSAHRLIFCPF
ncbi:unnamed protein product [marine sediment metagenome]|uniref:Solute-binding protein family 5 domain-containing protein n=1 Tax=marine sediment metagenome TaxID=412755 RepID=X1Q9Z4_9ZZZZ